MKKLPKLYLARLIRKYRKDIVFIKKYFDSSFYDYVD